MKENEEEYGESCPVCGTPWTVTEFNVKKWKDCTKCNKTAEELSKEKDKKGILPSLDDDWELLLDQGFESLGFSDDEDDWF